MEETIGRFAKRVGTTPRTLRYYDQIDLLRPAHLNEKGQKVYTLKEWERYQQIQVCKHLGMSLEESKQVVNNPDLSPRSMLNLQKKLLIKKKNGIEEVIETIERTERLFETVEIGDKEVDDLFFILLDSFRKEQLQTKALKDHFSEEVIGTLFGEYETPAVRNAIDQEVLLFYKRMRQSMEQGQDPTASKVQEMVKSFYTLLPVDFSAELLSQDASFFDKHHGLFSVYFPKELGDYIHQSIVEYFDQRENDARGR